ncbi:hypothetical protein SARC_14250 [Sphaeroforma arctica JP610]|uniref:Uncharacterized protein n=1 Tax=Sphaeroforma arctica JP610 TaxID=667725 RepID=A0A0L0F9H9_9EUKA|nr:hypothetical protein SARC_14250 [Sphaeroforma arctica JP610]KNC73191.1 hypothetical protein SARC_14250 [Sphaeroforma arctica JP610]|eukprot:XP_014147093.1 hypothetical protein SARC_14250 [Sphaeroforma arctica JP610]
MVAQNESFLGEPGTTPLLRSEVKTRHSSGEVTTARDRAAVFLAEQRGVDMHTPSDGGRSVTSDTSAVPEPATLSKPVGHPDSNATQPDSGTAGAATGGGKVPQTDAEKTQWAKSQQDEAVRQQAREEARRVMAEEARRY